MKKELEGIYCERCVYWDSTAGATREVGECRKKSPLLVEGMVDHANTQRDEMNLRVFPQTTYDDWCGEFTKEYI